MTTYQQAEHTIYTGLYRIWQTVRTLGLKPKTLATLHDLRSMNR